MRRTDPVADVRSFNRFYTRLIGLLREGLLDTPFSLAEARIIFELGQADVVAASDLRGSLGMDPGHLSRILARLQERGLLERQRSPADGRRQDVRLTGEGRRAFETLDRKSAAEIAAVLDPLADEEQQRLIEAMSTIQSLLGNAPRAHSWMLRPPRSGDFGWIVHRHGVLYAQEYDWDETFEALVARVVADYVEHHDARREAAWIAEMDGAPVGSVLCVKKDDEVAQLRLMLVEPRARGIGIGTRLCDECIRFARAAGYQRMTLWTNDVLHEARRIYESAGFRLMEENAHHSFGHDLVGQNWELEL